MKNKLRNSLLVFAVFVGGLLVTTNIAEANPMDIVKSSSATTCKPPKQELCNWVTINGSDVWICICK